MRDYVAGDDSRLKAWRRYLALDPDALAALVGISRKLLNKLEQGDAPLEYPLLAKFARTFEIPRAVPAVG